MFMVTKCTAHLVRRSCTASLRGTNNPVGSLPARRIADKQNYRPAPQIPAAFGVLLDAIQSRRPGQHKDDTSSLIATGLTNPQIAERLFMARSTVKTHVTHTLTKLGLARASNSQAKSPAELADPHRPDGGRREIGGCDAAMVGTHELEPPLPALRSCSYLGSSVRPSASNCLISINTAWSMAGIRTSSTYLL